MKSRPFFFGRLLLPVAALISISGSAWADTKTKANNTDNLNLGTSWSLGTVPAVNYIAFWESTVTGANSTLLGGDLSWGGIKLTDPGGAVTIGTGNTLTLGKDGIDMSAATQDLTISSGLTLLGNTAQTWNVASGRTLTTNTGTFTRNPGATLNIQGTGTIAAANISNVNAIVGAWATVGSGTSLSYVTKSGSNLVAYSGGTDLGSGSGTFGLVTATTNYFSTGTATLTYNNANRTGNTYRYGGAGIAINATGTSTLTINGIMNYGTGTLAFGDAAGTHNLIIGANKELIVHTNTQNISIANPIVDNGGGASALTFTGQGGMLTLTGANTFTGATTISGGTLYANRAGAANNMVLSFTSGITINNGGTLRSSTSGLFGFDGTQERNITVNAGGFLTADSGADVGVGLVTLAGGTLSNLGPSTFWGSWRFDSATDKLAVTENSIASAVNVKFQNGGSIDVSANKTLSFTGTITDSTNGGVSALVKTGAGMMVVSGVNTYTGATAIDAGTLRIDTAPTAGGTYFVGNGGTTATAASLLLGGGVSGLTGGVAFNRSVSINPGSAANRTIGGTNTSGTNTFSGTIAMDGSFGENRSTNLTAASGGTVSFTNTISGAGQSIIKVGDGKVTLSGTNTYTGVTTIGAGTLSVSSINNGGATGNLGQATSDAANLVFDGGTLQYTGANASTDRAFTINAGKTATVDVTTNTLTISGASATTNGILTKTGAGTLTLSGGNNYSGGTNINAGTLNVTNVTGAGTGVIALNGATLSVGAGFGNTTTITGNSFLNLGSAIFWNGAMTGNSGSTLTVNVAGTSSPGGDWSGLGGTVAFSGGNFFRMNRDGGTGAGSANANWDFGTSTVTVNTRHSNFGSSDITFRMGGLSSSGSGSFLTSNDTSGNGRVIYEVGALNGTSTYGGSIAEDAPGGNGYHQVALTKVGTGKLTLSGSNNYTGATTVSAGTLAINSDQSAATGNVTVSNTGTRLQGTGTVGGNTTINSGAIHAAGNSVGKQTFDQAGASTTNLTYSSGSIFEWELASTPTETVITDGVNYASNRGTAYDAVNVTGTLGGSGAIFRVLLNGSQNFAESFWNQDRTWTDIFRTGDGTGTSNLNFASIFSGFGYYNSTTGDIGNTNTTGRSFTISGSSLTWSAVPEPNSALAGLLVAAGFLRRRRK